MSRLWSFWGLKGSWRRVGQDILHHGGEPFVAAREIAHRWAQTMSHQYLWTLMIDFGLWSGYIPSGEALSAVKDLATKLRESNPELLYLLDRTSFSPFSQLGTDKAPHSCFGGCGQVVRCTRCHPHLSVNAAACVYHYPKLVRGRVGLHGHCLTCQSQLSPTGS